MKDEAKQLFGHLQRKVINSEGVAIALIKDIGQHFSWPTFKCYWVSYSPNIAQVNLT